MRKVRSEKDNTNSRTERPSGRVGRKKIKKKGKSERRKNEAIKPESLQRTYNLNYSK